MEDGLQISEVETSVLKMKTGPVKFDDEILVALLE